jgi:hypothetical protein
MSKSLSTGKREREKDRIFDASTEVNFLRGVILVAHTVFQKQLITSVILYLIMLNIEHLPCQSIVLH